MGKKELEVKLTGQLVALNDFVNGYKACMKFVLDEFDKKETKKDDAGIQNNTGIAVAE